MPKIRIAVTDLGKSVGIWSKVTGYSFAPNRDSLAVETDSIGALLSICGSRVGHPSSGYPTRVWHGLFSGSSFARPQHDPTDKKIL